MSKSFKALQEYVRRRPHDLFGKNYDGEPINPSPGLRVDFSLQDSFAAELLSAVACEDRAAAEQHYFRAIRKKLGDDGPLWSQETAVDPFNAFEELVNLIVEQAKTLPRANMVIVSPTALTMMQAAKDTTYVRGSDPVYASLIVGRLGDLNIGIDAYGNDDVPVLIGYVPENPAERMVSYDFQKLYLKDGFDEGWTQVRIDASRLTFS